MQYKNLTTLTLASIVMLSSCVSSKKYQAANDRIASLESTNSQQASQLSKLSTDISQLKTENLAYSKEAEDCRKMKQVISDKLDNLNRNLAEKGTSMRQIEQKINTSIQAFEDAGADVKYKNGLLYISYPDKFFFKKGSSLVGERGREALNTVAEVLRSNPGVTATIVGHTDTLSIKGIADNWSLSTERANAVVRILADVYNINPKRLTAAGNSKFRPVADNSTEEGREKNRRIQIVMDPDLSRIWDLMEKK
jgi:chemotaxis protein MotB